MIDYISSWAEQIIIAVIVVTILEMILPKGSSKKYIKTIIGIYVLYVIISPAIKLITKGDIKIDHNIYEKYFSTETSSTLDTISVEDTYNIELEKQIKQDIENLGYNVKKVSADLDLTKGEITKIVLSLDIKNEKASNINVSINKVEVGNIKEKNNLSNDEIQKIVQKLTEDYGIKAENITINSN